MKAKEKFEFIDKLRDKYKKAAGKYGNKIFNLDELEKRINLALETKADIMNFLQEEKKFFEKTKELAEKKSEVYQKNVSGNFRVHQIIEKNEAKIKQYPDSFFDPYASLEMRYFIGAVSQFYERFFLASRHIFRGSHDWVSLSGLFADLERFCFSQDSPSKPAMLNEYINDIIRNRDQKKKERIDGRYLQTAGSLLYKIHLNFDKLFSSISDQQKESVISFQMGMEEWMGKTFGNFLNEVVHSSKKILDDFRITDLVSYSL